MLRLLFFLLLAPYSVVSNSTSTSAGRLVFEFAGQQHIENVAIRSNGHLVLSVVNEPFVYDLDPRAHHPLPKVVHHFPGVIGTTDMAETAPDIFAVVAGNWSSTKLQATPGSFSIWSIDLNTPEPTVKLITSIPEAAALNGVTTLNGSSDIVLIADSALGAVWRVNVATGDYSIAIQNPFFTNNSTKNPSPVPIGINGVHTSEGMLYFTNSAQGSYGRIPITNDGSAAGEVEILVGVGGPSADYDDFDIDREGNAWIATHPNAVVEVTTEGEQRNITRDANITDLIQPVSVKFGRGSGQEEKTLYVVTAGSDTAGGQVIAVSTYPI